jgi:hypothetical protein
LRKAVSVPAKRATAGVTGGKRLAQKHAKKQHA